MSATPFKVKAIYEYSSPHDDDLSFPNGQIITVTEEEDADWYVGEFTDEQGKHHTGLFPKNFVERYEPEVPSRPVRSTRPKSLVQSPPTEADEFASRQSSIAPSLPLESKPAPTPASARAIEQEEPTQIEKTSSTTEADKVDTRSASEAATRSEPASGTSAKAPPPPVAAKSNAFKDRIAAFNRAADAPVLPFKPASGPGSYGIKKPFVAPPPSRNAYVPPATKPEPVQRVYRREEDPEIAERIAEDRAAAESAGLIASQDPNTNEAADSEDAPKPTSLKDRIALLQKQQMEQAQKRAEASTKEKPKRPSKKRTESSDQLAEEEVEESEKSLPIRTSQDISEPGVSGRTRTLSPTPMSPSMREHEILSDGNEADQSAAGETTANEDTSDQDDLRPGRTIAPPAKAHRAAAAPTQEPDVGDEEDTTEGQSEEDDMDEETRRKMELRERMAKISGGMGMAGMFGGPQPGMAIAPPPRQKSTKSKDRKERRPSEDVPAQIPPRSMVPVPGMSIPSAASLRPEDTELAGEREDEPAASITSQRDPQDVPDVEDVKPVLPPKESRRSTGEERGPLPTSNDRPVPVPQHSSSRPIPPAPPTRLPQSPDPSERPPQSKRSSVETPRATEIPTGRGLPPPVPRASVDSARSPPQMHSQPSYFGSDAQSEASIPASHERRPSRAAPPPVPSLPPSSPPTQSRPVPPPPPAVPQQTVEDPDEGESEYEGDYDTDIASSDKHKAALKAHQRQPSLDESTTADELSLGQSPPPPFPTSPPTQHRAIPPPPPPSQPPRSRLSSDVPRAVPPPLPSARPPPPDQGDEEGDMDNYKRHPESQRAPPPMPPVAAPVAVPVQSLQGPTEDSSDDLYAAPTRRSTDVQRAAPPPPVEASPRPPDAPRLGRPSLDASRALGRKSMDAPRPSTSNDGYIATDVDLSQSTQWWTVVPALPPAFQNRTDILFEVEETSSSKRAGKPVVTRHAYILFHDYSQTVISATFDPANPSDVSLEQRHEPPPARPRQDQLESCWRTYGYRLAEAANQLLATTSKRDKDASGLGDGSDAAMAYELIKGLPGALLPVGNRAYGAPVYANIGNASVQQHDEIRPGDLVTFRNARLQGKHGLQKYSTEVGGGSSSSSSGGGHVAVVVEWDGTKKKVRTVEQGRDDKGRVKVRAESYRLGDLKSGEVRVWRVVGREWVGWGVGK